MQVHHTQSQTHWLLSQNLAKFLHWLVLVLQFAVFGVRHLAPIVLVNVASKNVKNRDV